MKIDVEQIQALMAALQAHDFHEIEWQQGDASLKLTRKLPEQIVAPVVSGGMAAAPAATVAAPASSGSAAKAPEDDGNFVFITSPFVGTFYPAPSPSSPNFVEVGQKVTPGKVLCIVEAMKLMNEIESEVAGTLVEVLVEAGKPVEFGDRLFKLDPKA